MDVAELEILSRAAVVKVSVLGLAQSIIAPIVAVIHPLLSQRLKKSNNSSLLATVLVREALNTTITDVVSVGIAKQDRQTSLQPVTGIPDDKVGHDLNSDFFLAPPKQP